MKKKLSVILGLGLIWTCFWIYSVSATETNVKPFLPSGATPTTGVFFRVITVTDANNLTETLETLTGFVMRIVIDTTGTDTAFTVNLKDSDGVSIFNKTTCSSGDDPQAYAVSEADSASNYHVGVPVHGTMVLTVSSADTLTAIIVRIYALEVYQY